MPGKIASHILPETQRRTLTELTDDLDLTAGDSQAKRSAYWTMLTLSGVIASAGVLSDSTAVVIGAMIIAPLATPIMGIALGLAKQEPGAAARAVWFAFSGATLVILIGIAFALILPGTIDLLGNGQITGRTSPRLLDLVAAMATGFAGALALARRDVAAVLPGVAIAISLVPPLAVAGVCLGQGSLALALGALVLFFSNLLALVLAGTLVYAALGYSAEARESHAPAGSRRRAYMVIGLMLLIVTVPLLANTVANYLVSVWTSRVQVSADEWISSIPGAHIDSVEVVSADVFVRVRTPDTVPPVENLVAALEGKLPDGVVIVVTTHVGERIDAGSIGTD